MSNYDIKRSIINNNKREENQFCGVCQFFNFWSEIYKREKLPSLSLKTAKWQIGISVRSQMKVWKQQPSHFPLPSLIMLLRFGAAHILYTLPTRPHMKSHTPSMMLSIIQELPRKE